jgi:hypothetical protein
VSAFKSAHGKSTLVLQLSPNQQFSFLEIVVNTLEIRCGKFEFSDLLGSKDADK